MYYSSNWVYGSQDKTFAATFNYWLSHFIKGNKEIAGVISWEGRAGFGPSYSKEQYQRPAFY